MEPSANVPVPLRRRFLRPAALTAIIFFSVSGGPYGLEPVINLVGGRNAVLLVLITPLLWALPVIFMVLELNGMMPRNGGYYQWVKTGLGEQWGFFEGWWTWLYLFTDLAIYPVLFVEYASYLFPEISAQRYSICLAVIWICAGLNLMGILPVGRSSVALGALVILPFALLFAAASNNGIAIHAGAWTPAGGPPRLAGAGMGLFTVMWNYLGWDNASTFAEEVHQPVRSYLVSIAWAFGLIVVLYLLSILAALGAGLDPATLERDGFPSLGVRVGGAGLGDIMAAGGMASALGLFVSNLLSVSRLPKAMSDDGSLPAFFRKTNARGGTPYASIVVCALIISGLVLWQFEDLIIIDVVLYGSALLLEFFALISLRRRSPEMRRPFKIPLGRPGLIAMTALPAVCYLGAIAGLSASGTVHTIALLFALASLGTAPLAWMGAKRYRRL